MHGTGGSVIGVKIVGLALAGLVALLGVADRALAQVRSIETRYVTIVAGGSEGAALRCGPDVIWYTVAGVPEGEVLEVDGEVDGWWRASYPIDGKVVVKLSEGQHIENDGVVLLTRRSRLRAYNPQDPVFEECWKSVFPSDSLRAGEKLTYVRDMEDRSGALAGYVAVAPQGARGYIRKVDVRDATAEEIRVYRDERERLASLAPGERLENETQNDEQPVERREANNAVIGRDGGVEASRESPRETPVETPAKREEQIARQPETRQAETRQPERTAQQEETVAEAEEAIVDRSIPTESIDEATRELVESPNATLPEREETPARIDDAQRATEELYAQHEGGGERAQEEQESAAEPEQDARPVRREPPRPTRILTLDELDEAYERVVAESGENPEYGTLVTEYRRHMDNLRDEPGADRTREYIETRIGLLEIAKELADGEAELAALSAQAEQAGDQAAQLAQRVMATREFDLVGRLVSSSVYDGQRLPLLYRLVSVEGRVGRTVAYLTAEQGLGMDGKLGAVVGVRGEGAPGEVGLVRVIRPDEVVVLTAVDAGRSE